MSPFGPAVPIAMMNVRVREQSGKTYARILTFRPTLRKTEERLRGLRTAEGTPLPENTRAELCRHLARLRVVREQIRAIVGLDGSAQPSKGRPLPQGHLLT